MEEVRPVTGLEKVRLLRTATKVGAEMRTTDYQTVSEIILRVLNDSGKDGLSLIQLIIEVTNKFDYRSSGNVGWYILQVKQDMEVRNLIKKTFTPLREQFITLKKRRRSWY